MNSQADVEINSLLVEAQKAPHQDRDSTLPTLLYLAISRCSSALRFCSSNILCWSHSLCRLASSSAWRLASRSLLKSPAI